MAGSSTPRFGRIRLKDAIACVALFSVSLGVYVFTLAPTVTAEDSGELIAAAAEFGIPHPPGYPLWTMLCGIFVRIIPFGSIAYRANLFSAVCGSTCAVVVFLALRQLPISRFVAVTVPLLWVWSRWFWTQSVVTEVYSLNSLLTAMGLFFVLRWERMRENSSLVCASFCLGLGLSNQHVVGLSALALGSWVVLLDQRVLLNIRLVASSVLAIAGGLLPYAFLPWRASTTPAMNWGDPSTWDAFWDHVTRAQYGAIGPLKVAEPRSVPRLWDQLEYVVASLYDDLTPIGFAACLLALIWSARYARRHFVLALLWLASTAGGFTLLANFGDDRTSQWAMRVFLISIPLGVLPVLAMALSQWIGSGESAPLKSGRDVWPRRTGIVFACLIPFAPLTTNWKHCDYSNYWYAYDHAENLLRCSMRNALLFPTGDHNTFPLTYLLLVEKKRPDVTLADKYGYVDPELVRARPAETTQSEANWLIRNARRPVYYTIKKDSPVEGARFVPAGILYHLLPREKGFSSNGLMDNCAYRNAPGSTVMDHGADNILSDYHFFRGLHALGKGDVALSRTAFDAAAAHGAGIKELFNNLGSVHAEHGLKEDAIRYFREAANLDRRYAVPRRNLAQLFKSRNEGPRAEQVILEITTASPQDARAFRELGLLRASYLQDRTGAIDALQRSLSLDPNQPELKADLKLLSQNQP